MPSANEIAAALRAAARPPKPAPPLGDVLAKIAACHAMAYLRGNTAPQEVAREFYGDRVVQGISAPGELIQRGAVSPAMTTVGGWAAELAPVANFTDGILSLAPKSVYAALAPRGLRLNFQGVGAIRVPGRSATPTISGAFVGEGAPIPVRRAGLTGVVVSPRKFCVITEVTGELARHSAPSVENILRSAIAEDSTITIDSILLDNAAATTVRPAGLLNGVTATPATTGGGLAAMTGDLGALVAAIGAPVDPILVVGPSRGMVMHMLSTSASELTIVESPVVPATRIIMVDAACFISGAGDDLEFDVSKEATLHEEDTTPLAIATAGSPNVVAAPVRSLWQTDSLGLRMLQSLAWAMLRSGRVAFIDGATW